VILSVFSVATFAQKPVLTNKEDSLKYGYWTRTTQLGANASGSLFSSNWQGGGVNNIVLGGIFGNKADFIKGKGVWTNDVQIQVGTLTNYYSDLPKETRKNLDRLFAESKYSKKINPKLNYFAGVNLLSQLLKGYDFGNTKRPIISNLFAPAFLSEGIGLEYKPSKFLILSLGGATLRQTFVLNDVVFENTKKAGTNKDGVKTFYSYGVEQGKKTLFEAGFQGVAAYDKNITPKFNLKGRLQAFYAYAPVSKPVDFNFTLIGAYKLNLKIIDLPVVYRERTYAETNISRFSHGFILFRMMLFAIAKIKCW
ncbi:MAG: DUF3078 domain-containing protein, partial [Ignavibacteriaceae bacterium]|nr:DUF3078 domain-containing protein [Ignavibacteriaceae bacterium]